MSIRALLPTVLSAPTLLMMVLLSGCSSPFFYPDKLVRVTPDKLGINYHDVYLTSKDGIQLHAWHLKSKQQSPPKGIVLVLHGNAENISSHILSVAWLAEQGYELFLLDYRGYGQSEGEPSLPDVFLDIDAAVQWLSRYTKQYNQDNQRELPFYWLGQSIGASLSSYYLSTHNIDNLHQIILDAPFDSYRTLGREKLGSFWLTWPFQYPISWIIDNRFSPSHAAHQCLKKPALIFTSTKDVVVPQHHTNTLINRFKKHCSTAVRVMLTDTEHIATFSRQANKDQLLNFLDNGSP